jgi:hypothetical protein
MDPRFLKSFERLDVPEMAAAFLDMYTALLRQGKLFMRDPSYDWLSDGVAAVQTEGMYAELRPRVVNCSGSTAVLLGDGCEARAGQELDPPILALGFDTKADCALIVWVDSDVEAGGAPVGGARRRQLVAPVWHLHLSPRRASSLCHRHPV